jgi:hypothetical protein|tara:strand:- start:203 stop:406 length:204 start_codon:yes stop_codon:yes gene_type:complete
MSSQKNISSSFNKRRLHHINFLMKEINDSTDDIYESMVDRDLKTLKTSIVSLRKMLTDIEDSLKDEI